jgi:hypothetical protein
MKLTRANRFASGGAIDKTDAHYQVLTNYDYPSFSFSSLLSDRIFDGLAAKQTRDQKDFLGSLGYTRNNWGGWLDVLGNYSMAYTSTNNSLFITNL